MITEIIATNKTLNTKYKFGQDLSCDYLYKDGGVDWDNVPATHNTYTYPNQMGSTISSTKIQNRDITIEAYVYYVPSGEETRGMTYDEKVAYCYNKIKEKKKKLNDFINPLHYIRLSVGDYYIEGKPEATPKYGVEYEDNNEYFCKFVFTIFCDNPMFKKNTETKTVLSGDTGVFHFPLIFEPEPRMIMGTRVNYLMLLVDNEGNAAIGGKIKIEAKGEVQNPTITNLITNEHITINKTLLAGEVVTINTVDGEKKGVYGRYQGVESDYLQYWDFNNTWLKFESGASLIGYSSDNQSELLMDVSIELNPVKYGLEEM